MADKLSNTLSDHIATLTANEYVGGTVVNISSYHDSNPYTCPCDGYARVQTAGDAILIKPGGGALITSTGNYVSIYVHKGSQIYANNDATSARFLPLV